MPGRLARRALLVLAVLLSACTLFRSQTSAADEDDVVTLHVINHHALDVTIYNVRAGRHDRLGDVTAVTEATFTIHLRRLPANELQLFADPVGSNRGVTSEILHLSAGDTVEWTLENGLTRSHVMVR